MCVSFFVFGSYTARCRLGSLDREELRRRVARALLAEVRVLERPHRRGDPHAAALVEHRVVDVVLAGPDDVAAPVRRRLHHRRRRRRRVRIADGQRHLADRVAHRIEHRQVVGAQLEGAVDQAVGVERRIAPIGRDRVVQVGLRVGPVPLGDDDVALEALRPRRRGRHFARGDAIGPVREQRERAIAAELSEAADHLRARLPGLQAPLPRRRR